MDKDELGSAEVEMKDGEVKLLKCQPRGSLNTAKGYLSFENCITS